MTGWSARPQKSTTPPSGAYRLTGFARGQQAGFEVQATGYVQQHFWVKELVKDLKEHEVVLARGSSVRGVVVDGQGIPNYRQNQCR